MINTTPTIPNNKIIPILSSFLCCYDYHIITLRNNKDTDEFEMFNADKIERQDWNELVNKIMK